MKTILKIQKDSVNTLKEEILKHSNKELQKLYVLAGRVKESGYDYIEELLIDLKAKTHIIMGVDKKNTTKKMLDNVLSYTKNVFVWDNNEDSELNSNIFIFEYEEEAFVVTFSGDITDTLFDTDTVVYTIIRYDLVTDKKEYNEVVNLVTKELKEQVVKLTKEYITELSENKKIFSTRQYVHNIPSISELLGKKEEKTESEYVEKQEDERLPKVSLADFDDVAFEIDISDVNVEVEPVIENKVEVEPKKVEVDVSGVEEKEYIEENSIEEEEFIEEDYEISDEPIDLEELIFEAETVKLDKKKIEKSIKKENKEKKEEKAVSKKIDLKKVSNIIMELPKNLLMAIW